MQWWSCDYFCPHVLGANPLFSSEEEGRGRRRAHGLQNLPLPPTNRVVALSPQRPSVGVLIKAHDEHINMTSIDQHLRATWFFVCGLTACVCALTRFVTRFRFVGEERQGKGLTV